MNQNVILFRNRLVYLSNEGQDNRELAMSVAAEIMQFGFILDSDAIDMLAAANQEDLVQFHADILDYLKEATGGKRNHTPFWKGFPQEVMEKSECELWIYQILHYISNGTFEPNEWTKERPTAFEQPNYTRIKAGTKYSLQKIFTNLVSVNNSLTPEDLATIEWFVSTNQTLVFPDQIPFKENLCTLAAMGLDVPVKTVTDVLRIAVHMSGGDVMLPAVPPAQVRENRWTTKRIDNPERENFKFKKFKRSERRQILSLLEKTNCDPSEAVLKAERWKRLGEVIHPGEYTKQYPRAVAMFDAIRNNETRSWFSVVNKAFEENFDLGIAKLTERPGYMARRMDELLRNNGAERRQTVLQAFQGVAHRVSNKVLFELQTHFSKRNKPNTSRQVFIKGARRPVKLPELKGLPKGVIDDVQNTINDMLLAKFSDLDGLGKVYVDEQLKDIPMPTNMRSMSAALKPTIRGQRVPIGNQKAKVIRAYVHWFDERGSQDLDLTCTFIGMGKAGRIGWNSDKNKPWGVYSGDVRHRQGACAEYVDIVIDECKAEGYKYVIMDVNNYNGGSFASVTDAVAGFMEREHPKANSSWVPKTIANAMRLTNESSTTLVTMIDVETQEYIFLDIDMDGIPVSSANHDKILEAIKPYCEPPAFSVYDLVMMHVWARNGEVVEQDEAETSFTYEDFSESYVETLKLMGV